MVIAIILTGVLCVNGLTWGINKWLPKWISQTDFGLVEWGYRIMRTVAPFFVMYSLASLQLHIPSLLIWGILYLGAFWIKKLCWNNAYWDLLK